MPNSFDSFQKGSKFVKQGKQYKVQINKMGSY